MYYLPELAEKLGVNARTIRLYAQKKHFPSEISGNRLSFTESVYVGLLAHIGVGKPLSTFRMKVPLNQRGEVVKQEKISMTKKENTIDIHINDPDNDPDNEYILELEQKNSELISEVYQLKAEIRQKDIELREEFEYSRGQIRETLDRKFVKENMIYLHTHESTVESLNRKIQRLEKRIEHMARNPQPTDILASVAPPLIQMAEKWMNYKRETLADQQKARTSNTMDNSYRGGFEPRVNPDAKLKGSIPKQEYYDPETGL